MQKWLMLVAIVALGCRTTSDISRKGYEAPPENYVVDTKSCQLAVKFNAPTEGGKVLGTVEASEPGMGITCSEAYVLTIFMRDACSVGANLINLTEERQPNWASTCFRAKAQLVKMPELLVSDDKYTQDAIYERVRKGDELTQRMIYGGVMGGLMGGAIATSSGH